MLAGFVQLWLFDCTVFPPPKSLGDMPIHDAQAKDNAKAVAGDAGEETHSHTGHSATRASTWFQGHVFASAANPSGQQQQYALLGVPAMSPPAIHGCMISDHDTPSYYDVYLSEYSKRGSEVRICARNVERSGGSGDAVELRLEKVAQTSHGDMRGVQVAQTLKLSTARMLAGDQARAHLEKYARDALAMYDANGMGSDAIVCLGAISVH
ncbi:hypothetical protein LPJ73_004213 [Coemansia sp. RSA 2703]|nr:hypothetical protein LPJ73_004213 [Coemansia sp. RSA 2703]KAJ2363233.1 hypothetical protein IW150_006791 [Coemansia sp. RSA 2607]KAJ2386990.1 hypothetical protein GGI05_004214 [Coemansia sp. RSA 2603]